MKAQRPVIESSLLIIGRGLAGSAAAVFAAQRGLAVTHIGRPGDISFGSGLFDLMACHPLKERKVWHNPWAAIQALLRDEPRHPYRLVGRSDMEAAYDELFQFLNSQGLPYFREPEANCDVLTPLGLIKPSYGIPMGMRPGVQALQDGRSCLVVEFEGLADFSARQIAAAVKEFWPGLNSVRIPFPASSPGGSLATGDIMALKLESRQNRETLCRSLKPHLKGIRAVGFPAVLGLKGHNQVVAALEERLGVEVFEIPTLPVSVPGLRLAAAFQSGLADLGVRQLYYHQVLNLESTRDGQFLFKVAQGQTTLMLRAKEVILAGGRLVGHGLRSDRHGIKEPIFRLPVFQPANRDKWHSLDFLDPAGHAINRAGIEVDQSFRPVGSSSRPVHENLRAIGSILAHQDWMRMGCGGGLAITTAYGAVKGADPVVESQKQSESVVQKRAAGGSLQNIAGTSP